MYNSFQLPPRRHSLLPPFSLELLEVTQRALADVERGAKVWRAEGNRGILGDCERSSVSPSFPAKRRSWGLTSNDVSGSANDPDSRLDVLQDDGALEDDLELVVLQQSEVSCRSLPSRGSQLTLYV